VEQVLLRRQGIETTGAVLRPRQDGRVPHQGEEKRRGAGEKKSSPRKEERRKLEKPR